VIKMGLRDYISVDFLIKLILVLTGVALIGFILYNTLKRMGVFG